MKLGLVSNCWRVQLTGGKDLSELIENALRLGYRSVELRQGCLGKYETDMGLPKPESLQLLAERFPNVQFNIALNVPFFAGIVTPTSKPFVYALRAAEAVAGVFGVHVRLVDLATREPSLNTRVLGTLVAQLTHAVVGVRGILSLENASQRWEVLRQVHRHARAQLGGDAGALQFCYDACNLVRVSGRTQQFPQRLRRGDVALIHLKQSRDGVTQPTFEPGDVDWSLQLAALARIDYAGPALFEIAPHENIWDNLAESRNYLESLALGRGLGFG
jgi:sugar phosphate isomerase/epimerase